MANKIQHYIKKELAKGFSKGKIRQKLSHGGYSRSEIDSAFHEIFPRAKISFPVYILAGTIGIIVIFWLLVLVFQKAEVPLEAEVPLKRQALLAPDADWVIDLSPTLQGCVAYENQDLDICSDAGRGTVEHVDDCEFVYTLSALFEDIRRKDCTDIAGQDWCKTIITDCAGVEGEQLLFCQAYHDRTLEACDITLSLHDPKTCIGILVTAWASADDDPKKCEQIPYLPYRLWCEGLVGGSCVATADILAEDLSIYLNRPWPDTSQCDNIHYPQIQEYCMRPPSPVVPNI